MNASLTLENASVTDIVEGMKRAGLGSFFLEWEERFEGWEISTGNGGGLMLGDVQKEVSYPAVEDEFILIFSGGYLAKWYSRNGCP